MSHLKFLGLYNFKVFKEQTDFELRPLTILTGTNSSGKSSFIKGLIMGKALFNEFHKYNLETGLTNKSSKKNLNLSFLKESKFSKNSSLGGFKMTKNTFNNDDTIKIRLPFALPYQFEDMVIELSYKNDGKTMENAVLCKIEIFLKKNNASMMKFTPPSGQVSEYKKQFWECELLDIKTLRDLKWQYINSLHDYIKLKQKISNISPEVQINSIDRSVEDLYYLNKFNSILQPLYEYSPKLFQSFRHENISQSGFKNEDFGLFLKSDFPEVLFTHFILPYHFLFDQDQLIKHIHSDKKLSIEEINKMLDFIKLYDSLVDKYELLTDLQNAESDFMARCFKSIKPQFFQFQIENGGDMINSDPVYSSMDIFDNSYSSGTYNGDFINISKFLDTNEETDNEETDNEEDIDKLQRFFPYFISTHYQLNSRTILNHEGFKKHKIDTQSLVYQNLPLKSRRKDFDPLGSFFNDYLRKGIDNSIQQLYSVFNTIEFIPNIRSLQKRTIGNSETDYLGHLINEYHEMSDHVKTEEFLRKWVKTFEIADEIQIEYHQESLTSAIYLINSGLKQNIIDVGYGMSQLLPIILRLGIIISKGESPTVLVVEEPETNLHPKLQSKLADLFVECYTKYNIQLIIETHSEYLIRKLQYLTAKKEIQKEDTLIYYFNNPRSEAYKEEAVFPIELDTNGSLSRSLGPGFFDEAENIAVDLFLLRKEQSN